MVKLNRFTMPVFAGNAAQTQTSVFGTMKTSPQYTTDVATSIGTTAYGNGWADAIEIGYAPFMEDMNTLQRAITYQIAYNQQQGIPEWDSSTEYYKDSLAKYNSGSGAQVYVSLADNNVGNLVSDTTKWKLVLDTANSYVTLNTPQTITGGKTFTKEITEKVNMTKGTAPAASMYPKPYIISDSADSMVGNIQFTYGQNMSAGLGMLVYNCNDITDSTPAALQVFNVNGTKYATCPTPTEDTTGSIQIDTVGARNTKLGNYVTLGTEQTITGAKTFANNVNLSASSNGYRHIYSDNSAITKGTAPSANTGYDYLFRDSAGSNICGIGGWYNTNGNIYAALYAYNPTAGSTTHADLKVGNYASGRADVVFETPTGVANSCLDAETNSTTSNMLALKGWVNNPATATNVVHRSGNETIDGTKKFSENILTVINATRNVAPSTTQYGGIGVRDNANNLFASMVAAMDTNKNASAFLRVFNPKNTSSSDATYMTLHYDADGATYVTAPASDVANSIVTTINKSKGASGYFQLGNGLIVQWGRSTATSSSGSVTLPKAFTTSNYAVSINIVMSNVPDTQASNVNVVGWGVVSGRTTTSFTAFLCNYENSTWWAHKESGRTFTWIAIGY